MLSKPFIHKQVKICALRLTKFTLLNCLIKVAKGQVIVDFTINHIEKPINFIEVKN